MYNLRYKNIYRTNNPNLVISAVQYFPKMNNSVEKISQFIGTEKYANNLKLAEIVATYENYYGGHDFVPIHFANTCPKLEKLQKYIKTENMFVCIGYISLVYPSHIKFKEYVEYYPFDIDSTIWKWLFKQCILSYIHEQTSNWDIETKEHLFNLVGNSYIKFLSDKSLTKEKAMQFINNMYDRNIYEFIINEIRQSFK